MKLEGKIIVAQPIQSGVSKNGNNWQRQDFVLEIPGQYPKKVAFSVMNSNIQNFGLAVGQDMLRCSSFINTFHIIGIAHTSNPPKMTKYLS